VERIAEIYDGNVELIKTEEVKLRNCNVRIYQEKGIE
jgi:hypothetical protein